MADTPESLEEYKNKIKEILDFSAENWVRASDQLTEFATRINSTLGQGRQRIVELNQSIADAIPNVTRLGGGIESVTKTIQEIALASRRNVIANTEDVEKLFAATTLVDSTAEQLSNSFLDIGVGISNIPKQLENSLEYIRSIGGNSKQIFRDVQDSMDKMNRFQFEGGVVGLTKMAAQASMLRFSMYETFRLADKVLDPEGAVEIASAFQRLGVSVGNLVDPFQLMNQSINDPSGLQNSLAEVSKQFTYFDEKTKTFKINPQGVLTLRELEKQTGVSASEMSKMGLAAAELDKRLSAISGAGLKIASEEDKQYLANIATMTKGGTFEVKIKDEQTGKLITKELSDVTQREFDNLIKEQKEGPKTLEDISRSSLNMSELIFNDLRAIRDKLLFGVVSSTAIAKTKEEARGIVEATTGGFSKMGTTQDVRKITEGLFEDIEQLMKDIKSGKSGTESLANYFEKLGQNLEQIQKSFTDNVIKTTQKIGEKEAKKTGLEGDVGRAILDGVEKIKNTPTTQQFTTTSNQTILAKATKGEYGVNYNKTEITMGGKLSIDLNLPTNFSYLNKEEQQKVLDSIFNSSQFQNMVAEIAAKKMGRTGPIGTPSNSRFN